MTGAKDKTRKTKRIILYALAAVLVIALFVGFLFWNRYVNKESLIAEYETPAQQELFILGTLHTNHFNRLADYSMEDVVSAIENTVPDAVFIEARQQTFEESGTVDGPIDMCVAYALCEERGIPVGFIDWWQITNDYQENSTNDERDDHIFANIDAELKKLPEGSRVLVICGSGHFSEQCNRFEAAGFEKQTLKNKSNFFAAAEEPFVYPASASEVWEQRARFYAYVNPEQILERTDLSDEIKDGFWSWDHDAYYEQQLEYCEMFKNNVLYK